MYIRASWALSQGSVLSPWALVAGVSLEPLSPDGRETVLDTSPAGVNSPAGSDLAPRSHLVLPPASPLMGPLPDLTNGARSRTYIPVIYIYISLGLCCNMFKTVSVVSDPTVKHLNSLWKPTSTVLIYSSRTFTVLHLLSRSTPAELTVYFSRAHCLRSRAHYLLQ